MIHRSIFRKLMISIIGVFLNNAALATNFHAEERRHENLISLPFRSLMIVSPQHPLPLPTFVPVSTDLFSSSRSSRIHKLPIIIEPFFHKDLKAELFFLEDQFSPMQNK